MIVGVRSVTNASTCVIYAALTVDMLYKVNCSKSSDAVCDCESGYRCNSRPCTDCVKIPPPPTTTITTTIPRIIVNTKNDEQSTPIRGEHHLT